MLFVDTETCGFTGPCVLIQTGFPYRKWEVWKEKAGDTIKHIEWIMSHDVCLFNASFDSFHLNKLYNMLRQVPEDQVPTIEDMTIAEKCFWEDNLCLKPKSCTDLYCLALTTKYQYLLMDKKKFVIPKVPRDAVRFLKPKLIEFTKDLPVMLFGKHTDRTKVWTQHSTKDPRFVDLKLNFKPTSKLKAFALYILKKKISSIEIPKKWQPENELEWMPFSDKWQSKIEYHIKYWETKGDDYAREDIEHTSDLWNHLGNPSPDTNSDLAWMVGQVRAKGFSIDEDLLYQRIDELTKKIRTDVDTSPAASFRWLMRQCPIDYRILVKDTSDSTLEKLVNLNIEGLSDAAKTIQDQRSIQKYLDILLKLEKVGRWHPDFNIVGTFSNRMSGRGGFNPQGIPKEETSGLRSIFTFKDTEEFLSGGDFVSQEITILDAILGESQLRKDLIAGIKPHTKMAQAMFKKTEVSPMEYFKGKTGVFGIVYGAMAHKISTITGGTIEEAEEILEDFFTRYPAIKDRANRIASQFSVLTQPRGLGTVVSFKDLPCLSRSLLGHVRRFDLEKICIRALYDLACNLPDEIKHMTNILHRRDREQTVAGATRSALYAGAFGVQSKMQRAAGNNEIQSTGAEVTKTLQQALWCLQPVGVSEWKVRLFNVHDEVLAVSTIPEQVKEMVEFTIKRLKDNVPLLDIDWKVKINNWAEVKK